MHEAILTDLLAPLGLYRDGAVFSGAEIQMAARELDMLFARVSETEREAFLDTGMSWGLARWETLLLGSEQSGELEARRRAVQALLNISGDGLTLDSLNRALYGSGTWAQVSESQPGEVVVSFPGQPGIPDGFEVKKNVIEGILPCHLEIVYRYWYTNWMIFEAYFTAMRVLDDSGLSWRNIEMMVEETSE